MSDIKRQVFYSFHFGADSWRTSTVRNIGTIEGNRSVTDNEWQQVKMGGDVAIKKWIESQMKYRSCTVVLVGKDTANRKWINHEIIESWKNKMGVVGIYIHGLKDSKEYTTNKGNNPFDYLKYKNDKLSKVVKCYDPVGSTSKEKYDWITRYISAMVEEAIKIRNNI